MTGGACAIWQAMEVSSNSADWVAEHMAVAGFETPEKKAVMAKSQGEVMESVIGAEVARLKIPMAVAMEVEAMVAVAVAVAVKVGEVEIQMVEAVEIENQQQEHIC